MSTFKTVNPKNEETLETFRYATDAEVMALVSGSGLPSMTLDSRQTRRSSSKR